LLLSPLLATKGRSEHKDVQGKEAMPAYRLITGYNLAVHGIEVDRG